MKCLTAIECSNWLDLHGIVEAPYQATRKSSARYFQFRSPTESRVAMNLVRRLIGNQGESVNELGRFEGALGKFEGGLIAFKDWETYPPDMLRLITSIRQSHGEQRWLIDAPGHLFEAEEDADVISQCYLIIMFGWTAYLYLASKKAILLFWEGDLVDFWSPDEALFEEVKSLIKEEKLHITCEWK